MDGRRNYPQDPGSPDPDARWYDERAYSEQRYPDAYGPDYNSPDYGAAGYDPFRKPDAPGYGDPVPPPASLPPAQPSGPPVSGGGAQALFDQPSAQTGELPIDDYSRHRAEAFDREELRRTAQPGHSQLPTQLSSQIPPPGDAPSSGAFGPAPTGAGALGGPGGSVYRGKRPGLAVLLIVLTVLFELPVLRIFFSSALVRHVNAPGTISSIFMILGLPMFALGLYGLIGGAAAMANGPRAWLRVPLAYLPVGLLLFLAAALA